MFFAFFCFLHFLTIFHLCILEGATPNHWFGGREEEESPPPLPLSSSETGVGGRMQKRMHDIGWSDVCVVVATKKKHWLYQFSVMVELKSKGVEGGTGNGKEVSRRTRFAKTTGGRATSQSKYGNLTNTRAGNRTWILRFTNSGKREEKKVLR